MKKRKAEKGRALTHGGQTGEKATETGNRRTSAFRRCQSQADSVEVENEGEEKG